VAVGNEDGSVQWWDIPQAKKLRTLVSEHKAGFSLEALSGDGRLAALRDDGRPHLLSPLPTHLWRLDAPEPLRPIPGPTGWVTALAWSGDSRSLAVGSKDRSFRVCRADTGQEQLRLLGAEEAPAALAFSARGDQLAALDELGRFCLWQQDSGQLLARSPQPARERDKDRTRGSLDLTPKGLRFSADGRQLLGLCGQEPPCSWNISGKEGVPGWKPPEGERALALAANGRQAATLEVVKQGEFSLLRLRGLPDGKVWARIERLPEEGQIQAATFSDDGRLLAVAAAFFHEMGLSLIETATGQQAWFCPLPGECTCMAFSPDGRTLAVAVWKHWDSPEVWLIDLVHGRKLGVLHGHEGIVRTIAFSPDGRTLATGSEDRTVLLWDASWPTLDRVRPALPPGDPEILFCDLTGTDAVRGQEAMWRVTLPLLLRKLQPVAPVSKEQLARLIRELEHDEFARRDRACQELLRLGDIAAPALRRVLEGQPQADLKRLIDELLDEIKPEQAAPYRGAVSRAVAVLERIGSPQARQLLRRLAEGEPAAYLTRQARETLERLEPPR